MIVLQNPSGIIKHRKIYPHNSDSNLLRRSVTEVQTTELARPFPCLQTAHASAQTARYIERSHLALQHSPPGLPGTGSVGTVQEWATAEASQ